MKHFALQTDDSAEWTNRSPERDLDSPDRVNGSAEWANRPKDTQKFSSIEDSTNRSNGPVVQSDNVVSRPDNDIDRPNRETDRSDGQIGRSSITHTYLAGSPE